MPTAACLIRYQPHYRHDAFHAGLKKIGYAVATIPSPKPQKDDVLVTWNRYGHYDTIAKKYEAAGATVLVVENGWAGKDPRGRQHYAIARSHHNGCGTWFIGPEDRWTRLGVEVWPWRTTGAHILVLPQRGIGPPGVAMPKDWTRDVMERLRSRTKRTIILRPHPGKEKVPLDPALTDCWAAVTWGSGAGIKALIAGIPVFHELKNWVGAPAARFGIDDLEKPALGERFPMLRRLAWHQWSILEIENGLPFECLVGSPSTKS